jgi:formylglycine-generating enzyme required for sulfatase activity
MAVSAGTAVITVTAVINSNIYGVLTYSVSCTVTVTGGGGNNNGGNNASWTSPTGIIMMQINAGTYTRGIVNDSKYSASPPHQVTLTKNFYMGKYVVTQDQYMEVMGYDPSENKIGTSLPVDSVTWYDAVEFCNKLSVKENRTPVYTITVRSPASGYPITSAAVTANWNANGYRLPTEAEWEYACRAGTTTLYNTGDEITPDQANFGYSLLSKTTPVDSYDPNAWGLHDMHGNVNEWCWDGYGEYTSEAKTDPLGPDSGVFRVIRGGSFNGLFSDIRSASRLYENPGYQRSYHGFRIVCLSSAVTPDDPDECNENCLGIGAVGPGGGIIIYHYHPGITITGYGNAGDPGYFPSYTARYLEAAPVNQGEYFWASPAYASTYIQVRSGLGRGRANTAAILAVDANAPAALACRNYTGGGKNDWFLPSIDEAGYFTMANAFLLLTPGTEFWTSSAANTAGIRADYVSIGEDTYSYGGIGSSPKNSSTSALGIMRNVRAIRAF